MKTFLSALAILLLLQGALVTQAAQTANARAFCLSPKLSPGSNPWDYELYLTTINAGWNGELSFGSSDPGYSHSAWIGMWYPQTLETLPGFLWLNLPDFQDANLDGFDDFYDVTQASGGNSIGECEFEYWGLVGVSASWSRAAGSRTGTCVLALSGLATFTHSFEIKDFRGDLSYTPGAPNVVSTLAVTNLADPSDLLGGSMLFEKDIGDPFNTLWLQPGSLTNAVSQTLAFALNYYARDGGYPTNYYGWLEFADGDPATGENDFYWWMLSIDDLNDSDQDGIPDFSDTPAPRRAVLSLAKGSPGLTLTISADVGSTWRIEKSASLSGGWTTDRTVTLPSDPHTVALPEPATRTFWRAVKQ
jgi:hypothetical protein